MSGVLEELRLGARVVVIRLRSLGDCVLATPAISLMKASRPDIEIAIVVDPKWAAIYEGNPDVSAVLQPRIQAVRGWNPDLVLNLHGGSTSARLVAFSGARWRAGFSHYRFPFLYNLKIPRAQEILGVERTVHTCEHVASAMFWLGVAHQPIPRARLFTGVRRRAKASYAVIHPVASEPEKTWPSDKFREIAGFLKHIANLEPVFLGAAGDNLSEPFGGYQIAQGQSLSDTKALVAGASLFIGNDSGPAHLAAAFDVPSVVLFGASNPEIWGPWRNRSRVIHQKPIRAITVESVCDAVAALSPQAVTQEGNR